MQSRKHHGNERPNDAPLLGMGSCGLTDQDKAGYLPVLEWFESFRSQRGLEPGSEAAELF
jgi:hypothetical protein